MTRCTATAPDGARCGREAGHPSLHYAEVADGAWEWGDLPDGWKVEGYRTRLAAALSEAMTHHAAHPGLRRWR